MVSIEGLNWCNKFLRPVDSKLVRELDPDCIKEHNGCGNCPDLTYKVFTNGMEMDDNEGPADFYHVWRDAVKAIMVQGNKPTKCVVCGELCPRGKITCCDDHHEEFVQKMELRFGSYKKVLDMDTGVSFKVPIRDIIEKGLKQEDLINYEEWNDSTRVQ